MRVARRRGLRLHAGFGAFVWSARDGGAEDVSDRGGGASLAGGRAGGPASRRARRRTADDLREFAEAWLDSARDGSIRNRSGDRYKPSTIRGYEQGLREYVLHEIGAAKLQELRRQDIQDSPTTSSCRDINASTVRNALMHFERSVAAPSRVATSRSIRPPESRSPPSGAAGPGSRCRAEARELIEAAPAQDRALWATAFYAGLRRGELRALRWIDVDLAGGVIRVERSWDVKEGVIDPKSTAGHRGGADRRNPPRLPHRAPPTQVPTGSSWPPTRPGRPARSASAPAKRGSREAQADHGA